MRGGGGNKVWNDNAPRRMYYNIDVFQKVSLFFPQNDQLLIIR